MKLAACYTVFNGLELLKPSIEQIRHYCDVIIICYQTVSNKGNTSDVVEPFLEEHFLHDKKTILAKFTPNLNLNTKENERVKHQKMIELARIAGCTHFFLSATDHFYKSDDFVEAKHLVDTHDFDLSFTAMYTYYKHPTWQLYPIESYYMPFIMKLYPYTEISRDAKYPVLVDPSVKINTNKRYVIFQPHTIMLHHYSMIRENIRDKFTNAAASIRWKKSDLDSFIDEYENYDINKNPGLKYFQGRKIQVVANHFGL
jgi:hypothetical protein